VEVPWLGVLEIWKRKPIALDALPVRLVQFACSQGILKGFL
jgi:hypothetical protein